jgi:hypothetical protein
VKHFQQILYVCPKLFIHKWEVKGSKAPELVIEVPKNIKDVLNNYNGTTPSLEGMETHMHSEVLNRRKALFEKCLF